MEPIRLTDDEGLYEVLHVFNPNRVVISYRGLPVIADRIDAEMFELTDEPARPGDEQDVLNAIVREVRPSTTTTAPDGSTQTYYDEAAPTVREPGLVRFLPWSLVRRPKRVVSDGKPARCPRCGYFQHLTHDHAD